MIESKNKHWTFYGVSKPSWSLILGWGAIYGLLPAWFISCNLYHDTTIGGWYSLIAGLVALLMGIKHKSIQLVTFALAEIPLYLIIAIFNGVNTP